MSHPKSQLSSLGAKARKSLSQNFLSSPHWIQKLTDAALSRPGARFWEVGPGLGALTERLLSLAKQPVTVFEYDRKFAADLRVRFPQIEVVEGDFIKVPIEERFPPEGLVSFLSNVPYHLSSPMLFKLLEHRQHFTQLVMTFQKEYADRLTAHPRTKDYGALTLLIGEGFEIENLGILPPGAFYPAPSISSKALRLIPRPPGPVPLENLSRVVKAAFAHRRKKLISNLKSALPDAPVAETFDKLGLSSNARAEELSREVYLEMTALLF